MNTIKEFFARRNIAYFIALGSTVLGLIAFIVYLAAGTNEFVPEHSAAVIVAMAIGTAFGLLSAVKTFKLCVLTQYVVYLYGMLSFILSNINLFGNLFYNVDGSTIPVPFIIITLFSLLSVAGALTAGIMIKYGSGGLKNKTVAVKGGEQI